MFVSGGRVSWLTHAYAVAIVATLALKMAALVRLRRLRPATRPFQAPFNLHVGAREIPLGPAGRDRSLVGAGAAAMIIARDAAGHRDIRADGQPLAAVHGRRPRERGPGSR